MTVIAPVSSETTLIGRIVTSNVTTTATTIYVAFTDSKTGAARTPQATTLYFTFNKDNSKFEIIKCDSHSTASGITTLTVNAAGRAMPLFGVGAGGATGNAHNIGELAGVADIHWYTEVINKIIDGTNPTSGTALRVGNEADDDIYYYAQNADGSKPYLKYDKATNAWVFANDGASENPMAGSGALNAGDGLDLTAGTMSTDLKANAGLEISATELAVKAGDGITLSATGVDADLVSGGGLETSGGEIQVTPGFTIPTGGFIPFGGSSAPTGFLLCDDSAVSRTTYAALFAVIGTAYGVGDGATTFNVPDLRGNVAVGKDAGTFSTLGATGGVETHSLSEAELPAHVHTMPTADQSVSGSGNTLVEIGGAGSANTGSVGSGTAHQNLQPYQVVNYIIKT